MRQPILLLALTWVSTLLVISSVQAIPHPDFSTVVSPVQDDQTVAVAVNDDGTKAYVVGRIFEPGHGFGVPTTDLSGQNDAFLAYFVKHGNQFDLVRFAYFGGVPGDQDRAKAALVGPNQNVYITGALGSLPNLPAGLSTSKQPQGATDAFVAVFNPDATGPIGFAFAGGELGDIALGIAINPVNKDIYICGSTTSPQFLDPNNPSPGGGDHTCGICGSNDTNNGEGFIARFDAALHLLGWTYVKDQNEARYTWAQGIAIGPKGDVYVTGSRGTLTGNSDAFIAQYPADLGPRTGFWSMGFGNANADLPAETARGIAVNSQENVYITGEANSSIQPVNALPGSAFPGPFVYEQDKDANVLFLTSLGIGTATGYGEGLRVDPTGTIIVSGRVAGQSLLLNKVTPAPSKKPLPDSPGFVAAIRPDHVNFFSTYLAGNCTGKQDATATAIDLFGQIYVAGYTPCSDFPPPSAKGFGGGVKAFFSRLSNH